MHHRGGVVIAERGERAKCGRAPRAGETVEGVEGRGFMAGVIAVVAGEDDEVSGSGGECAEQGLEAVASVGDATCVQV